MSFAFCFFASSSMIGAGGDTFHPTALRLRNTKYVLLVCSMDRTTSYEYECQVSGIKHQFTSSYNSLIPSTNPNTKPSLTFAQNIMQSKTAWLFVLLYFTGFFVDSFLWLRSNAPYQSQRCLHVSCGVRELEWDIPNLLMLHKKDLTEGGVTNLEPLLLNVYRAAIETCAINLDKMGVSQDLIVPASLPDHFKSVRQFLRTSPNDLDHEGRFRIFSNDIHCTTSLPSNLLFSMDSPLTYIREKLSYRSDINKRGGMLCENTEAIVCCVQKDDNLEYTSRVLDDMPLAQLHLGGFPDCLVELESRTIRDLQSLNVLREIRDWSDTSAIYKVRSQDLNVIKSLLSSRQTKRICFEKLPLDSSIQWQGQETLIKLIDCAVTSVKRALLNDSNEPHLVLIAHSINACMVAAALSKWKQQKLIIMPNKLQHIEDLLKQAVTVVTIGALTQDFCNGPAYIHFSMHDDGLVRSFGSTQKSPEGGGKNAVYFHAVSPYLERNHKEAADLMGSDAHNMNACVIQFLCLVMRINGITSFRDLYDAASYVDPRSILDINPSNFAIDYSKCKHGDLVIPLLMDEELIPAMIRATGGDQWLWNPIDELNDLLPDAEEAKVYLEEFFGYSAYEEIYELCFLSKIL